MPNTVPAIPAVSLKKLPNEKPAQQPQQTGGKGEAAAGAIGALAPMAAGLLDAIDSGNQYGRQSRGTVIGKGVLTGAASGAALGPIGAAAGAVLGGVTGLIQSGKQQKAEKKMLFDKAVREKQMETDYSASQLAANPSLYQGYKSAQYFKHGGKIRKRSDHVPTELLEQIRTNGYALGGTVQQLSSDGTMIQGNSHEQGGVKIPALGIELEGNETTKGDYVFSDALGFAQLHKPIMKAKGKIEAKPYTKERANSIRLLEEKENQLKLAQEFFKTMYGITR